ncbi:hypothetical protein RCL1_008842 [Eukaryota sp. TZLM3-RCL]
MSTPPAQNNKSNSNKTTSSKTLSRENLNKSSLDSIRSRTLSVIPSLCSDLTLPCNTSVYSAIIVHKKSIKGKKKFFVAHAGSKVTVEEFVSTIRNNFETESSLKYVQQESKDITPNTSVLSNQFEQFESSLSNFESICNSKLSDCDTRVQNLSNRFSVISLIIKSRNKISNSS